MHRRQTDWQTETATVVWTGAHFTRRPLRTTKMWETALCADKYKSMRTEVLISSSETDVLLIVGDMERRYKVSFTIICWQHIYNTNKKNWCFVLSKCKMFCWSVISSVTFESTDSGFSVTEGHRVQAWKQYRKHIFTNCPSATAPKTINDSRTVMMWVSSHINVLTYRTDGKKVTDCETVHLTWSSLLFHFLSNTFLSTSSSVFFSKCEPWWLSVLCGHNQ